MFKTRVGLLMALALHATVSAGLGEAETAAQSIPEPPFRPTATIEELMQSIIDPAADAVWDSVVTDVTPDGTTVTQPETADDWNVLRRHAITLIEATNLLLMEGRSIASTGSRSELPGVDLEPEDIQSLLAQDPDSWAEAIAGLYRSGVLVLQAVDDQDIAGLLEAGATLDLACEACHSQYWYPGFGAQSVEPPTAPLEPGR